MTSKKPCYASLGSISEGTLRDEDLVASFSWELRHYMKRLRLTREQRKRFAALLRDCDKCDFEDHDEGSNDFIANCISELQDALDELAPPYSYFGTLEGDGACFGFWPVTDHDELPRYPGITDAAASREAHDCYVISDHGNVTCGHISARGRFVEYWNVV